MSERIPDEIWEAARALRGAVLWESNSSVEHIARTLMARDKRAAEIARKFRDIWTIPGGSLPTVGAANVIIDAILTYDGGRDG